MKFKIIAIILTALIATSCSSIPSHKRMASAIEGYELPKYPEEGKAIVYMVRPSSAAFLVGFSVYVDEKETKAYMGKNGAKKYIYFNLEPGEHYIISKAENTAKTFVKAEAGDIIFIEQQARMGILFARNSVFRIDDTKGTYLVKRLKEGKSRRTDVEE